MLNIVRIADMINTQKVRDWLHMALKEYDAALNDFRNGRYSEAILHAQQCAERVCKSILTFLGFAVKKTHHPTDYIVEEILEHPETIQNLELSEEEVKYLVDIVTLSSPLERQGAMPRYGWETKDRIITPDEIYKEETACLMLENARLVLIKTCEFYRVREVNEILGSKIREVDEYVKKFRID